LTEPAVRAGRYALVVAESDYGDPKLRNLRAPAADAESLAGVLSDPDIGDFEVDVALDEPESQLRRRIARFFSNRRPDDLLLVHFSCHGVKDESGELYLAAADTEVGDLLGATGISSSWLSEQIGRSRSKRVVVLLDCCFSGSFSLGMRPRAGEEVNVREHLEGRGRAVITASSAMEYSYEGDHLSGNGQPSVFTRAVVEGLRTGEADRDGDKWISVDDLYDYVYERVKETAPAQSPNKMSTLEGQVYLARSCYEAPVAPAKLNDELVALTKHPIASARLGGVQELAKLTRDDNRSVALAARQVLEQMTEDDSLSVREAVNAALRAPAMSTTDRQQQPTPRAPQRSRAPHRLIRLPRKPTQATHPAAQPAAQPKETNAASTPRDAKVRQSRIYLWSLVVVSAALFVGGVVVSGLSKGYSGTAGALFTFGVLGLLIAAVLAVRRKLRTRR
jgi:uncharacterized caspase-like protein